MCLCIIKFQIALINLLILIINCFKYIQLFRISKNPGINHTFALGFEGLQCKVCIANTQHLIQFKLNTINKITDAINRWFVIKPKN